MSDRREEEVRPEHVAVARLEAQAIKAQVQNIRLRIKRGEMIPVERAERVGTEVLQRIRDALLAIPSRQSAILAAKYRLDTARLHIALNNAMVSLCDHIYETCIERVGGASNSKDFSEN